MMTKPVPYQSGDDLTPIEFTRWWGVFNAELSVRGLQHAPYGTARDYFNDGLTASVAADFELRWVEAHRE